MFRFLLIVAALPLGSAKYLRNTADAIHKFHDPFCVDGISAFNLPESDDPKNCDWLSQNKAEYGNLCDLHHVSSLCRVTCGVCEETSIAIDLLKTCSDRPDPISLPGMDSQVSCSWLRRNKQVHGDACELTKVALYCPSSCCTFGLCTDEQDENA
uniref:ShKT domain-containing protein n=1 Tax=Amphora coffeiformis TaxID=265554 RepID=A0A7S3L589_9STRA|mmetsp:Transcript_15192/g.28829  ORF Transcript_15192/g.28829 Transcript_15192/m.28829 type:complete len:155 (-) Transcript_15192:274-738(-)|eukprot:scaffold1828_cov169-Amphora_coffeaeformis.AAC.6